MDTDEKKNGVGPEAGQMPETFGGASTTKPAGQDPAAPRPAQSLFEPAALSGRLLPEDLPYAAEVEAALARRPARGAIWLSVAVFAFFVLFIVWAGFATLDEVTHAEGQVIPSSRTQIIQNLEGGILSSVEVHEGQIVEKNDVLARINNEMAESNLRDMLYKAMENLIAIRRLRASVSGGELTWPEDLRAWLERGTGYKLTEDQLEQGRNLTQVQEETFAVQERQRKSELDVLKAQSAQRTQEVKEQLARKDQLTRSLSLIRQQLNMASSPAAEAQLFQSAVSGTSGARRADAG